MSRIPEPGFQVPREYGYSTVWSILLVLHNSGEDAMGTAYKTITALVGTDLQTPTSKLEWEISQ